MKNKKRSKIIKLLVTFVIISIIAGVCIKRWNAWFGNPVEPPYVSSDVPARIQLTFGNDGQFSRNISWQCGDTTANSHLFIVKTTTTDTITVAAEGKMLHTQGGTTVLYRAKLVDLAEGEYSYSVCTGNRQSNWHNFTVSANNNFHFVYIGDIQDTINGITKNLFASINQRERDAAFWVFGGDVIERPHDRYWNEYFTSMDSIAQTMPVIACPGNHEYHKGVVGKLDERFVYTFSHLVDSRSNGHAVFDMRYGNAVVITLDSNSDAWTLFSQRRRLKQSLQKAQDAEWKIVILHHPFYSVRGKFKHYFIRHLFDPLIREYGVDIVLQGHEHCYARMITNDKTNTPVTPVYLISQFSPKDYRINFNKKYDRFGNGFRFYQTVDIGGDTLSLKTYTENNELYDYIRIVKSGGKLQVSDLASDIPEYLDINLSRIKKMKPAAKEAYRREIENRLQLYKYP